VENVQIAADGPVATVTLGRGKVNALDPAMVEEIRDAFRALERDPAIRAIVLTGRGSFFSFGFDIPGFMNDPPEEFRLFLARFTELYAYLYLFPKPVVAALNGHTIAGGCMIAIACDFRIMASGKGKISLNEVTFGASVFAGCIEILRDLIGTRNAETVCLLGDLHPAEEALRLGLVDQVTAPGELAAAAAAVAQRYAERDATAFRSIKALLRRPVAERMFGREEASIREFNEIWYSPTTREHLGNITIRS
jgi:enoyl-CoA hydratase/carnithine racemase